MASAVGRQRGMRKQLSSEDQALNMIAREAEARLSAKRAARAEARSIRMKELERKQKEIDDLEGDELDCVRRKNSSRLSSPSTTSPRGSDLNIASSAEHAVMKESLKETEDKYKKAMVNAAQLDNERQALLYQVEVLKDIIEDLEEGIHNAKDELHDKTKEFNKLSHDNENVNAQLKKSNHLLSERERILDEHGINWDGTMKETDEVDGEPDEASPHLSQFVNHINDDPKDDSEKQAMFEEIENLRNEVAELKSQQETTGSRKQAEQARPDLERSFVDVSSEADAIRDNDRHSGLYVNNNEKCDEFEVIDDGSQAGGMRNFEDKSFERSGRSSLLSSARTELATDSVESEVPLEISLNATNEKNNKEDYDIVQIDDPTVKKKKRSIFDVERLSGAQEQTPSPPPSSNINIDKYLFSDNDDNGDGDETETASTFNIDMYFATEESKTATVEDKEVGSETKDEEEEEEDSMPEMISNDPLDNKEDKLEEEEEEEEEDSPSPFLEVKSEIEKQSEENVNDVSNSVSCSDEDEGEDLNQAFTSSKDIEEHCPVDENAKSEEKSVVETEEVNRKLCMEDKEKEIRKSVEDFYESIISDETPYGDKTTASEGLPAGATFGDPISLPSSPHDESDDEPAKSPTEVVKKKEGWLVRVESFSTPASCTPQIKVISDDTPRNQTAEGETLDSIKGEQSPTPVPKQRKKNKKKKKRQKSVDIVEAEDGDDDVASSNDGVVNKNPTVANSDNGADDSPAVSPSKTLDHSDIPKQFLDASSTLGSGSLSDLSDVEQEVLEDGTTVPKKRSGSKKKNKEGCKTQ